MCGRGQSDLTCRSGKCICDNKKPPDEEVTQSCCCGETTTTLKTNKKKKFNFTSISFSFSVKLVGREMRLCVFVLSVCVLLCPGVAQDCSWDRSTEPGQSLDPASLSAGAVELTGSNTVSDPESCRASCCAEPACDLALVGFPMDGTPQCTLVSCGKHRDACVLRPDTQFKVYRKKQESETRKEAPQAGESPHIEPLLGENRSNHTDHGNNQSIIQSINQYVSLLLPLIIDQVD